jgi:phenylacetate-CoA ligase
MIWNPEVETIPRHELRTLQLYELQNVVQRVYERVPLYRQRCDESGVEPRLIETLDDLRRLPFTSKRDFRDSYPFGLFAVPVSQTVRIHATSGPTDKPIVVGYTENDIRVWAEVCARCLAASGAQPGDVFQNAYGYGLFTGGLGMHYGAELMGLVVVPASAGNAFRQIMLLQDFGTKIIACTPSFAMTLAETLAARGIQPGSLPLRYGVLGAEPWTEAMKHEIEGKLGITALNIYGLAEVIGPGVSCECTEEQDGAHIFEDHFLVEVIHPKTGDPVPPGEMGELVFTTLTKEALPVIRYRTGDLASLNPEPCRCGRTCVRMSRVMGRADDMLVVRGVNVYPSQVEAALVGMQELTSHYQLTVSRQRTHDQLGVAVEVNQGFATQLGGVFSGEEQKVQELAMRCRQRVQDVVGITARVTLVPPGMLPRDQGGEPKRVVNERGF